MNFKNMGYKECAVENTKQFLVSTLKSIIGRIELNAHLIYHDPCVRKTFCFSSFI